MALMLLVLAGAMVGLLLLAVAGEQIAAVGRWYDLVASKLAGTDVVEGWQQAPTAGRSRRIAEAPDLHPRRSRCLG